MAKPVRSFSADPTARRRVPRGALLVVPALLAVAVSLLPFVPSSSLASTQPSVTVTVTASPASGGTVAPGATITYRLRAESSRPLPADATVVDDLSGLLENASIATPPGELAKDGLTPDTNATKLTWTLPPPAGTGGANTVATTSFRATVAASAPDGATLTTTAASQGGEPCNDNDACATTLTVQDESPSQSPITDSPTPSDSATPTQPTPSSTSSPTSTPTPTVTPTTTSTPSASAPTSPSPSPGASSPSASSPTTRPSPHRKPTHTQTPSGRVTTPGPKARLNAAAAVPCTDPQNGPVVVGGFEIDGNLCTNNASNSDWDAAGAQPIATDPIGSADTSSFAGGVSEANGPNWTVAQTTGNGIGPGQARADIGNLYASTRVIGADVFTYFGFELQNNIGTTSLHVELNQKPNGDASCPRGNRGAPSPCRTVGDLLLGFDKSGSTSMTLAAAWTWNGSAWVPRSVTGAAVGRVNNNDIHTLTGGTIPAGEFGEAAVNLTALFGPGSCSGSFGTLNVRTSASTTLTSNLIDWVQPLQLGVPSTCPKVVLQKHWVNGSDGDTARLSLNGATTAPGLATSTANGQPDFTDTLNQATTAVEPGSQVNLAETLGSGNKGTYTSTIGCDNGVLTPPQAGGSGSFTMPPNANASTTVTCTVTNTRQQATMTLTKVWATSTAGDTAGLRIDTPRGSTGPTTSTAPTSTTITAPVLSGEPVDGGRGVGRCQFRLLLHATTV